MIDQELEITSAPDKSINTMKRSQLCGLEFQTSQSWSTKLWAHNKDSLAAKGAPGNFLSLRATNISVNGSTNNVPGPPYSSCKKSLNICFQHYKPVSINENFGSFSFNLKVSNIQVAHEDIANVGLNKHNKLESVDESCLHNSV